MRGRRLIFFSKENQPEVVGVLFFRPTVYLCVFLSQMKPKEQLHNKPSLKQLRKDLSNYLTPAEAELWKHLKNSALEGRKFRR